MWLRYSAWTRRKSAHDFPAHNATPKQARLRAVTVGRVGLTFAPSVRHTAADGFGEFQNFHTMAQTTNTTATANNEVVNPQSATPKAEKATTLRVVETRDMWAVVFDHTATLLARVANGYAVEQSDAEDFAYGKVTPDAKKTLAARQQPHIRPYMYSLLAGFASRKGIKHAKGTALEGKDLADLAERVFTGLHPKGDFEKKVASAEPKQAKSIIEAVIAKL